MGKYTYEKFNTLIAETGMPLKYRNALRRAGYDYIGDLNNVKTSEILRAKGIGIACIEELKKEAIKYSVIIVDDCNEHGKKLIIHRRLHTLDPLNRAGNKDGGNSGIENLGLSNRIYGALRRANINKIEDLKNTKLSTLYKIRGLGNKSIAEIINVIRKFGINIVDDIE